MKITMALMTLVVMFCSAPFFVSAEKLTVQQIQLLKHNDTLLPEMKKMMKTVGSLDTIVNRKEGMDFAVFETDATKILEAVSQIRKLDTENVFSKMLNRLEIPARKLHNAAMAKDAKSVAYTQEIVEACFKCHAQHRDHKNLE